MDKTSVNNIHTVNLLAVCLSFQLSFFKNSELIFNTVSEMITEFGVSGKSLWFSIIFSVLRVGATAAVFYLPVLLVDRIKASEYPLSVKRELPLYPFYIIFFCMSVSLMTVISLDFIFGMMPELVGSVPILPEGRLTLFLYFLSVVIIPAFFGEIFFRGVVLQALLPWGRTFAIFAAALTGAVFADNMRQFVLYGLVGLLSGYFVSHTGSLWMGSFISLCCNALLFLHDFIITEGIYLAHPTPFRVVVAVIFALGVFSCIKMDDQMTESKVRPITAKEREKGIVNCLLAPCVVAYYIIVVLNF